MKSAAKLVINQSKITKISKDKVKLKGSLEEEKKKYEELRASKQ